MKLQVTKRTVLFLAMSVGLGFAALLASYFALPQGVLEVTEPGAMSPLFLVIHETQWGCEPPIFGWLTAWVIAAIWMLGWGTVALQLSARLRNRWAGGVVIGFALVLLAPVWPSAHFVCATM